MLRHCTVLWVLGHDCNTVFSVCAWSEHWELTSALK
jgi:hypothetical protein